MFLIQSFESIVTSLPDREAAYSASAHHVSNFASCVQSTPSSESSPQFSLHENTSGPTSTTLNYIA